MSIALLTLLCLLIAVVVVIVLMRFGPSSLDLLDLNPEQLAADRRDSDQEDMRQLLELANRDRREAGRPQITEDDLRYGPGV
jgi:hypothetical protein